MINIQEDHDFIKNHIQYPNRQLTQNTAHKQLQNAINSPQFSLSQVKTKLKNINTIDAKLLHQLFYRLFAQQLNPKSIVGDQKSMKLHVQNVLDVASLLLSISHDREQLIRVFRNFSKNRVENSKKQKNAMEGQTGAAIDPQFILLLGWMFGDKKMNIALVQLVIDAYAITFILQKRDRQTNNNKSNCLEKWKNYIKTLSKQKQLRAKIQNSLLEQSRSANLSRNSYSKIIHIPL